MKTVEQKVEARQEQMEDKQELTKTKQELVLTTTGTDWENI